MKSCVLSKGTYYDLSILRYNSVDESSVRFKWLQKLLSDKKTEVYLLFYSHIPEYFGRLNRLLQRDDPIIAIAHDKVPIINYIV